MIQVLPQPVPHALFGATISNPAFVLLTDAACCLSVTSGGTLLTYVTDNQNGFGTGVSYYSSVDGSSAGSCCGDQAPYGIDVIPGSGLAGRMIFSETSGSVINSYYPDGGFAATVAPAGSSDGQVLTPRGIAVLPDQPGGDNTDTIYVAEHGNSRIQVFVNTPPPTNQAPVAISESIITDEDIAKSIKLNATDADNDALTYSILSSGSTQGGRLENLSTSDGYITYRPPSNYNGPDSFDFQVNDGTDNSNVATIDVTVNPVNDAPVAKDDKYSIFQDSGPTTLAVGQNDSDVELDAFSNSLCIDSVSDPVIGSVGIAQACGGNLMTLRYTPEPGFVGAVSFTYNITDNESPPLFDTAMVTVNVLDNVPPTPPVLRFPTHGGSINDNTPTFDWENSNDSSPVTYSLTVTGPGSVDVITEDNLNSSEFTATTPLADGGYDWRVTPRDSAGNGGSVGYSSVDNFGLDTVAPSSPIISDPANLTSTQNTWVVLSGTAEGPSGGFTGSPVVRIYDNVSGPAPIGNFSMDGSTFDAWSVNVTGLADAVHSFKATVTDKANNTSPSSAATIVTVQSADSTPPVAPALLSPANTSVTSDNTPTFDWSDVNDTSMPITYNLQVNDSSGATALSAISAADSSTFTPAQSASLPDGNYTWHVRAADNEGGGGWDTGNKGPFSSIFIFQVDTTSPEVVSVDPPHGATGVSLDSNVTATFDDAIDPGYLNMSTFRVFDNNTNSTC